MRLSDPNKLVYSAHDYGPGRVPAELVQRTQASRPTCPALWDKHWAYLTQNDIAPVLIGEFGGSRIETDAGQRTSRASGSATCPYLKEQRASATRTGPGTRTPATPAAS